jgi:uncharacterized protein YqgC (DUF456 family)
VGVVIVAGLVGVVVPLVPGLPLVLAAVAVWAVVVGTPTSWAVLVVAAGVVALGTVGKYLVPGRRLRDSGVPWPTTAAGAVLAIVGFFVVPVVGAVAGFVGGVYVAERARLGAHAAAWPSTRSAVGAVWLSLLIELGTGLVVAALWLVAAIVTS